jgi:excisionase family DNA binding protein
MDKPNKLLLRPVEVAAMLSISRSSVYELIAAGDIPSIKLGDRMVRVPAEAIREIVERRRDDAL